MDNQLEDQILIEIAKRFPYSLEDVRSIYDVTGSIDATIKACEAAVRMGISSLTGVIVVGLMDNRANKSGPSETK